MRRRYIFRTIAKAVFTEIINASVAFELCVVCVLLHLTSRERFLLTRGPTSLIRSTTVEISGWQEETDSFYPVLSAMRSRIYHGLDSEYSTLLPCSWRIL